MDVIVVGGGLIGSAASKYLAERDGVAATVFASPEPAELGAATGPFASHYDQGRVTRIADADPFWADAARRSIEQYRAIEDRSGIAFYTPRPLAFATPLAERVLEVAIAHGAEAELVDADRLARRTGVRVPDDHVGGVVVERSPAGFIDPRRLVRAQLSLAEAAGARVVRSAAVTVERSDHGVSVTAADGTVAAADRILFTTGAYGAELAGVDLPLERRLRTVALLEVRGLDAGRLPTLIVHELDRPRLEEVYWVPPVRYPDGGTYLKIGGDSVPARIADATDPAGDIADWFRRGGSDREAADLFELAVELLPEASVRAAGHRPCVVTVTPTGRPLIERIDECVHVAVGGNGAAAKSSDALGRDAAGLVCRD